MKLEDLVDDTSSETEVVMEYVEEVVLEADRSFVAVAVSDGVKEMDTDADNEGDVDSEAEFCGLSDDDAETESVGGGKESVSVPVHVKDGVSDTLFECDADSSIVTLAVVVGESDSVSDLTVAVGSFDPLCDTLNVDD